MSDYHQIKEDLKGKLIGEIFDDFETLKKYSRDASLFEVWPRLVVWPKNAEDIKNLVKYVSENKRKYPDLSIAVRAAGSCMSGGSLTESIVVDVTPHMNKIEIDPGKKTAVVEPGAFYRDFEKETLKHNLILPCYTASKNLCALGGMIGNNAAGEKTLQYGKMENFVLELDVVLKDGNLYNFRTLPRVEALRKSHEHHFEGEVYERMMRLIDKNREIINHSKPRVSKNSAGYYVWNIERSGTFDLTKVLVGSQGTLGIVTEAKISLVDVKPKSRLLVIFMDELNRLGELVDKILPHNPESIESYDDYTLKLAIKFLPEMMRIMKAGFFKLLFSFIPEAFMVLTGGMPKLVLLVEFSGNDESELQDRINRLKSDITTFGLKMRSTSNQNDEEKYWTIRRESFNLLRKHIKGKRTAPFIDDICVRPEFLPEFLPKLRKILDQSRLVYTIAGHAGNGNFHIIPLMDMRDPHNRAIIPLLSERVYDLVNQYEGTITAEHNDGIVRTPYLHKMYKQEVLDIFKEVKEIFDPQYIFNPGKKVRSKKTSGDDQGPDGSVEYMMGHIAKTN
jgi:FAD/FMN-containing dehydrogenase